MDGRERQSNKRETVYLVEIKRFLIFEFFYFITPTTFCVTLLAKYIGFSLAYIIAVPFWGAVMYLIKTDNIYKTKGDKPRKEQ